jgi:hypothetical protein
MKYDLCKVVCVLSTDGAGTVLIAEQTGAAITADLATSSPGQSLQLIVTVAATRAAANSDFITFRYWKLPAARKFLSRFQI